MRYDQLLHAIGLFKPRSIIEIGTWNGDNAVRMIKKAQKYHKEIEYYGYDLFEDATNETDKVEFNIKPHNNHHTIQEKIAELCPGAKVTLIKGNTRETLKDRPTADFAYIDGGHSLETIASDYGNLSHIPVVIFDDFYIPHDGCPDIEQVGCNKLVAELTGVIVLPHFDPVVGGGMTGFVLKV